MITCHIRYVLDPRKLKAFEHYGKPCNIAELVGLMEFTKSLLLYPEE